MTETVSARDQIVFDVFVTAIEGGINDWAGVSQYHWETAEGDDDLTGFYAIIHPDDPDSADIAAEYHVSADVVKKGLRLASTLKIEDGEYLPCSDGARALGFGHAFAKDDWDEHLDAETAGEIIQLGLFGKVVFG